MRRLTKREPQGDYVFVDGENLCPNEVATKLGKLEDQEDQIEIIKKALLEGIETIEFGVINNPFYISLKKDYNKENSVCLNVYVKEEKLNHTYSLDSYGYLWKLKNDKWKEELNAQI